MPLAASLAAGQPQPAERYAMPAVAPEAAAPTGRQAEVAPAAEAAQAAAAAAPAPRAFDGRTILHNLLPGERPSSAHVTVRALPADSVALCDYLLEEGLVACVPGAGFGTREHIRLSYATSMERITKAMDRVEKALGELAAEIPTAETA